MYPHVGDIFSALQIWVSGCEGDQNPTIYSQRAGKITDAQLRQIQTVNGYMPRGLYLRKIVILHKIVAKIDFSQICLKTAPRLLVRYFLA